MRVLLIIDHIGLGGAQRQIVELACGLRRRGHEVELFAYFPKYDFFRPLLQEHGVVLHEYDKGSGFSFGLIAKLTALLRGRHFDAVISYLTSPNIYAELAGLFGGKFKLIVSERVSHHDDKSAVYAWLRRAMHVLSDKVVTNSRSHCDWLRQKWWLREKSTCIYNGLNLQLFRPQQSEAESGGGPHFIGIGRIGPQKNILNLIAALASLWNSHGTAPQVSWAGQRDESQTGLRHWRDIDEALEALPEIRRRWHWLGTRADVPELLRHYDALIHPSFYEGLPNVVCEALAAGVPVLASDVCDHPLLVADGERGFLFDPGSPASIAAAIGKFTGLSADRRRVLSHNAREYAEANLGIEKMVSSYERLLAQLLNVA
jgi:glycosyltransferase involved in cell wall biosynthesis